MSELLVEEGIKFLRIVKRVQGSEACGEAAKALGTVLGTPWSNAILATIIRNGLDSRMIRVTGTADNRINLIKTLRQFTGIGLGEAKRLTDQLIENKPFDIPVPDSVDANDFIGEIRNHKVMAVLM